MNANQLAGQYSDFNPYELLRRTRGRRNFSERFDSFSDVYVWVLAACVALVYLISALYGAMYALLGRGVAQVQLVTAVWDLESLTVILIPLLVVLVFRLLTYLGPGGLGPTKADWWLALPIDRQIILRPVWVKALGVGAMIGAFTSILWLAALFGLNGTWPLLSLALGVATFAVAGMGLAALAMVIQSRGWTQIARRFSTGFLALVYLLFALGWVSAVAGWVSPPKFLGNLNAALFEPASWAISLALVTVLSLALLILSRRAVTQISVAVLRQGGIHQQQAAGALMQGDSGGLERTPRTASWLRQFSAQISRRLPVAYAVMVLRFIRGEHWRGILYLSATVLVLFLAVQRVTNPLSALLMLGLLLGMLNAAQAKTLRPMLIQPEMAALLGVSERSAQRAAAVVATSTGLLSLGLWSLGLWALGLLVTVPAWLWCGALLLAALGLASASMAHAQRGERDWNTLLGASTSEVIVALLLFQELFTLIRALAAGAVLYFVLLAPQTPVPWGLWAIALVCAYPAAKKLVA